MSDNLDQVTNEHVHRANNKHVRQATKGACSLSHCWTCFQVTSEHVAQVTGEDFDLVKPLDKPLVSMFAK